VGSHPTTEERCEDIVLRAFSEIMGDIELREKAMVIERTTGLCSAGALSVGLFVTLLSVCLPGS
jgi:hypothetical protein